MRSYDIVFSDGKKCRCLAPEEGAEEQDRAALADIFCRDGHIVSITRCIPPVPEKLPWRLDRAAKCWRLGRFVLTKPDGGKLRLEWPGGQLEGGKDEVRAAVVENWTVGVLT